MAKHFINKGRAFHSAHDEYELKEGERLATPEEIAAWYTKQQLEVPADIQALLTPKKGAV